MRESGQDLDAADARAREIYPQLLVNVRVKNKRPLEELDRRNREIRHAEAEFGDAGRILVRFSGTEPLARVMVEGPELKRVEHFATASRPRSRRSWGNRALRWRRGRPDREWTDDDCEGHQGAPKKIWSGPFD